MIVTPSKEQFKRVLKLALAMKLDVSNHSREQFRALVMDGEVVGFGRIVQKGEIIELATLGVSKSKRSQGVGEALVAHLSSKYDELYLVTVIPEYFKKMGFEEMEQFPMELNGKMNDCELWHGYGEPKVMRLKN